MYGKIQTKQVLKELEKKRIDCLLLFNFDLPQVDQNFYYFSGAKDFEISALLIRDKPTIYVPEFEIPRAERETWIKDVQENPGKGFLKTLSRELRGQCVGINGNFLPLNFYKKLCKNKIKVIDVADLLVELRYQKNKEEIKLMKKAVSVTKKAIRNVSKMGAENEIAAQLYYEFAKQGMTAAYDLIVAYDADSTIPHFEISFGKGGKCLLIDIGACYKEYKADLTRTFVLDKHEKKLKEIYTVVKEAHDLAIDAIRPGVKASTVDKIVRSHIKKAGYKLMHSSGHGLGLDVHERPFISPTSKDILKEGNIFTIEPGIYLKGKYGVRIEDDILVTKNGCEVL